MFQNILIQYLHVQNLIIIDSSTFWKIRSALKYDHNEEKWAPRHDYGFFSGQSYKISSGCCSTSIMLQKLKLFLFPYTINNFNEGISKLNI